MLRIPLLLCLVSTLVAATALAQDTEAPARQKRTPSILSTAVPPEAADSALRTDQFKVIRWPA